MDNLKKEFGKRLAEIRKSKKLNQQEFKEMIDAPSVQMISGWENGHTFPSANYLIIIAKKLDTSLDYLLLGKPNDQKNRAIRTYKDAIEHMLALQNSGLFNIKNTAAYKDIHETCLTSYDKCISNYVDELDKILIASNSLKKELFEQALVDLSEKYDFAIEK